MVEERAKKVLNNVKGFTVLWSGGKDSTATLLWTLENVQHRSWNVLYIEVTGNTHPLCTQYVRDLSRRLGIEDKLLVVRTRDFFELMERWGPPLLGAYRWCLYQVKKPAFKSANRICVSGVRRSDSKVRARGSWINRMLLDMDLFVINPLFDWSKEQVLDYLKDRGVPQNPCYALYHNSGNCMFCPYADKLHVRAVMSDPEWRSRILAALHKHRDKCMKGKLGRSVYERWTKWASQTILSHWLHTRQGQGGSDGQ